MTAIVVFFGVLAFGDRRLQQSIAAVEKLGGRAYLNTECDETGELKGPFLKPSRRASLASLWQTHLSPARRIVLADFSGAPLDDNDLRGLQAVPAVVRLDISDTQVSDAGVAQLARLTQLRFICVNNSRITRQGVKELCERLPGIIILDWNPQFEEIESIISASEGLFEDERPSASW